MEETWIVDFGSQYTQLITRQSRELGYKTLILTLEEARQKMLGRERPSALILSGGPQSIFEDQTDYSFIFEDPQISVLGVCYGMQIIGQFFGGKVERGKVQEYGEARVHFLSHEIEEVPESFRVWMSHSDHLSKLPSGFQVFLESENGLIAAIVSESRPIVGLQFHPEVNHTEYGKEVLRYFYRKVAKLPVNWSPEDMLQESRGHLLQVGKCPVLCAFSGGVDSLVAACLAETIMEDNLHCFFVDHGLLRPQDHHHIRELQKKTSLQITILNCQNIFLDRLKGISDPEEKRKVIGNTFVEVFEEKVKDYQKSKGIHFEYLLQGTLYPDVIESISPHKKGGKSLTIKSHHNVGGLPERMNLKLIEPFRFLFKDEVRQIGKDLGLPSEWILRHPFPGPGMGVRILGEVDRERIHKVQVSDQILFEELKEQEYYDCCWQAFTVLLPLKTVGVKGDKRAYEEVICLRIVNSTDGMTATWSELPASFLARVSNRITNEVKGITRVVYDITPKPPGTIEWE